VSRQTIDSASAPKRKSNLCAGQSEDGAGFDSRVRRMHVRQGQADGSAATRDSLITGAIGTRCAEMKAAVVRFQWQMRSRRETAASHGLKKTALPTVGRGHGEVEQCPRTSKGARDTANGG
jgi:hypothetical protein